MDWFCDILESYQESYGIKKDVSSQDNPENKTPENRCCRNKNFSVVRRSRIAANIFATNSTKWFDTYNKNAWK